MTKSTPSKRYFLIKAMLDWVHECGDVPYLLVDACVPGVDVPIDHVRDGSVVLNISHQAVKDLHISEEGISCHARFSGVSRSLFIPIAAAQAIYAGHANDGLVFPDELVFQKASAGQAAEAEPILRKGQPSLKLLD